MKRGSRTGQNGTGKNLRLLTASLAAAGMLMAAGLASAVPAPAASFETGVALYQKGQFQEAAAEFGRLAAAGTETPSVYYNLANSWLKAGQIGKGVWALERAYWLDPRDEDIRFNRALVKAALGEPVADAGVLEPVERVLGYVRTSEIELALQMSTILLVLCMLACAYVRSFRALFGTLFWILLLISTLVWGAAGLRWNEVRHPAAVIQEKEVFVRYGPAESNSKSHQLKEGAMLRIEKQSGDWYLVRLAGGQSGWIPKSAVLRVTP